MSYEYFERALQRQRIVAWIASIVGICLLAFLAPRFFHSHTAKQLDCAKPESGLSWKIAYDSQGRILSTTGPVGKSIRFDYSQASGALASMSIRPDQGSPATWRFSRGQVIEMADELGKTTYSYDSLGRLISAQKPAEPEVRFAYDAADRLQTLSLADGYRVSLQRNYLGRIVSISTPVGVVRYNYQSGVGETRRTLPNGAITVWRRTPDGKVESLTHGVVTGPTTYRPLVRMSFNRGAFGRLSGVTTEGPQGTSDERFEYDVMGRLKSATSQTSRFEYEYDDYGNRIGATDAARPAQKCAFDWAGRLTNVNGHPVSHDAEGNITSLPLSDGVRTYEYDLFGRLVSVSNQGNQVRYRYDGAGRLARRTTSEGTTSFVNDPLSTVWKPLEIRHPNGVTTRVVWDGDQPLATIEANKVRWLLATQQGTPRLELDQKGALLSQRETDPWGVETSVQGSNAPFGFTGCFQDREAGGLLISGRLYVPELGCFLQPDPKLRIPSPAVEDTAPFSYCGDDPLNYVDRTGASRSPAEPGDTEVEWIRSSDLFQRWRDWSMGARNSTPRSPQTVVDSHQRAAELAANAQLQASWLRQSLADLRDRQTQRMMEQLDHQEHARHMLQQSRQFAQAYPVLFGSAVAQMYFKTAQFATNTGSMVAPEVAPGLLAGAAIKVIQGVADYNFKTFTPNSYGALSQAGGGQLDDAISFLKIARPFFDANTSNPFESSFNSSLKRAIGIGAKAVGGQLADAVNRPSPVGGVCLTGSSAKFEGLGRLTGVRIGDQGVITLLGDSSGAVQMPPIRLDDIVTVFRSVYQFGEGPTVTIDPNPEGPDSKPMVIKHSEATKGTYVGWVLYEADRLMKAYTIGADNATGQKTISHVPGYEEVLNAVFSTSGKRGGEPNWERFWIVPASETRLVAKNGNLTIFDVPLKVRTQKMRWQNGALVNDSGPSSAGAVRFTKWFTSNYDLISQERNLLPPPDSGITQPVPVFSELRRIAVLTAIAEKLRDSKVPMPGWMRDYPVHPCTFETSTPIIRQSRGSVQITGGVNISADPKVVREVHMRSSRSTDERRRIGRADKLDQLLQARPISDNPVSSFKDGSDEAMTIPGDATRSLNAAHVDETDLELPIAGGEGLKLRRSFSSFFVPEGPWGKSWSLDLPHLDRVKIPIQRNGDSQTYRFAYDLSTPLGSYSARFSEVRAIPELPGYRLQAPEAPGRFWGIAEGAPNFLSTKTQEVLLKTGEKWHFDPDGQLVAIECGTQTTVFERDQAGRLTRIVAAVQNRSVAEILLAYESGRMVRANAHYLGVPKSQDWTVSYHYDGNGQLASVHSTDGEVDYGYDRDLLNKVTLQMNGAQPYVRRLFTYGPDRRLVREVVDGQDIALQSGVRDGLVGSTQTSPSGQLVTQFDRWLRPVSMTEPDGTKTTVGHLKDGTQITRFEMPGEPAATVTRSLDGKTKTLKVDNQPLLQATYNAAGNLTGLMADGRPIEMRAYAQDGRLLSVQDPGKLIRMEYDKEGHPLALLASAPGRVESRTNWTRIEQQASGRALKVTDSTGLQVSLGLSADSQPSQVLQTLPNGAFGARAEFDEQGRMTEVKSSWGDVAYAYDRQGLKGQESATENGKAFVGLTDNLVQIRGFDGGLTKMEGQGSSFTTQCPNGLKITASSGEAARKIWVQCGERVVELTLDEQGRDIGYSLMPAKDCVAR